MLDMLKERKAALEAQGEKGFTLMEMLIVIAIIAVLIAVAIPLFTTQLEKARDATSIANIRSAYAEAQAAWLTNTDDPSAGITVNKDDRTVTVEGIQIESTNGDDEWSGQGGELPFDAPDDPGTAGRYTATFTYNGDLEVSVVLEQAS